jgi:hypothetical protein
MLRIASRSPDERERRLASLDQESDQRGLDGHDRLQELAGLRAVGSGRRPSCLRPPQSFIFCWAMTLALATLALASTLAHAAPSGASVTGDLANSYRMEVAFDPASGALSVKGVLEIVADRRTEEVRLLLNDALRVRSFTLDGRKAKVEPVFRMGSQVAPGGQAIVLPLDGALAKGQRATATFRYDGQLTSDKIQVGRGIVSPAWSELTLESFWYPIFFEEPLLRSELILSLPERYQVTGPGTVERLGPGRWRLTAEGIVSGRVTFAASNSWHIQERQLGRQVVAALYTPRPYDRSSEILDSVEGAFSFFRQLFGDPQTSRNRIKVLHAVGVPGVKFPNQAFATAGDFIVMSNGEAQPQLDTLHHEVAHLWWSRGRRGTADEFLSESFSEYMALRYGEVRWGADWLARRRAAMAKRSSESQRSLLSLAEAADPLHQLLLYDRGPTALWALHDRIGTEAMDALLRETYQRQVATLPDFLALVARRHGSDTSSWLRAQL